MKDADVKDDKEYISVAEAAHLLGISRQRVQQLLYAGKIKGAVKEGRFWRIPLYGNSKMPKVLPGTRGPKGTWRKRPQKTRTYLHVNQQTIRENRSKKTKKPVICVRQGRKVRFCHKVELLGGLCQLIYDPDHPKDCGATVWLDIDPSIELVTQAFKNVTLSSDNPLEIKTG